MSKERVIAYGEVFTPHHIVKNMCDVLPASVYESPYKRVLEPSCGEGVFLLEVLSRKLQHCVSRHLRYTVVDTPSHDKQLLYEMAIVVSSLYGIDIQLSNVNKCACAMFEMVVGKAASLVYRSMDSDTFAAFRARVWDIIFKNIVQGDTLTMLNEQGEPIIFYEWKYHIDGVMEAIPRAYKDIVGGNQLVVGTTQLYRFWGDV